MLPQIPSLPSYDEAMKTNRHIYDRIIAPVLKGSERLAQPDERVIIRYSFIGSNAKPLYYDSLDYDSFINADLIIEEWNQYPETDLEKWDKNKKMIRKTESKNRKTLKTKKCCLGLLKNREK